MNPVQLTVAWIPDQTNNDPNQYAIHIKSLSFFHVHSFKITYIEFRVLLPFYHSSLVFSILWNNKGPIDYNRISRDVKLISLMVYYRTSSNYCEILKIALNAYALWGAHEQNVGIKFRLILQLQFVRRVNLIALILHSASFKNIKKANFN